MTDALVRVPSRWLCPWLRATRRDAAQDHMSCVRAIQSGKTVSAGRGSLNRAQPSSTASQIASASDSGEVECSPRHCQLEVVWTFR